VIDDIQQSCTVHVIDDIQQSCTVCVIDDIQQSCTVHVIDDRKIIYNCSSINNKHWGKAAVRNLSYIQSNMTDGDTGKF
jgi:hypothetical protein